MKQSPYSPHLNICDRWVFHKLKTELRKTTFHNSEEVKIEALRVLRSIPEDEYHEEVEKLLRHCEHVTNEFGCYITD